MANIFRYTIEDCNRIMFILKEYVNKQLQKLGYPEDKKYFNYYLFLEIFENRTEETLQELLNILQELNKYRSVECYEPGTTELSCFYYTYINRKINGNNLFGGTRKVQDKNKVEKYCNKVITFLLSYKQLFRMLTLNNYNENLRLRLNKLKDCYFDSVVVGIDELKQYNSQIVSLRKSGFDTLNEYLKYLFNKKIGDGEIKYLPLFVDLDVLPNYFSRELAKKKFLKFRFPFNLYADIFGEDIMYSFLSSYNEKYDKFIEYKLKEIIRNRAINTHCASEDKIEYYYRRNFDIIIEYYKNNKHASEICVKYNIGYKTVLHAIKDILFYIRRNPRYKNSLLNPNSIIDELKEKQRKKEEKQMGVEQDE